MFICGSCGKAMTCLQTGAEVYFEEANFYRSCDIYNCRTCKTKVLGGFGSWYKKEGSKWDVVIGISINYASESIHG